MNEDQKSVFTRLALFFLISRFFLEIVGVLGMFYFPPASAVAPIHDLQYHQTKSPFLNMWVHWDSEWYLLIADHGYHSYEYFKEAGRGRYLEQDTAKFLPAYPMGIR